MITYTVTAPPAPGTEAPPTVTWGTITVESKRIFAVVIGAAGIAPQ